MSKEEAGDLEERERLTSDQREPSVQSAPPSPVSATEPWVRSHTLAAASLFCAFVFGGTTAIGFIFKTIVFGEVATAKLEEQKQFAEVLRRIEHLEQKAQSIGTAQQPMTAQANPAPSGRSAACEHLPKYSNTACVIFNAEAQQPNLVLARSPQDDGTSALTRESWRLAQVFKAADPFEKWADHLSVVKNGDTYELWLTQVDSKRAGVLCAWLAACDSGSALDSKRRTCEPSSSRMGAKTCPVFPTKPNSKP